MHVVVGIAERRGFAGSVQPVGIDQGMAVGRDDLDVFHADAAEFVGHEIGGLLYVGLVFFQRADARDAEEVFEFA